MRTAQEWTLYSPKWTIGPWTNSSPSVPLPALWKLATSPRRPTRCGCPRPRSASSCRRSRRIWAFNSCSGRRGVWRSRRMARPTTRTACACSRSSRTSIRSFSAARMRPRGHLGVDLGSSVASRLLVPAMPEFLAHYPEIRIDLGVSDRDVDLIGDNVDCVIRGGALPDTELISRTIYRAAWITCATPGYLERFGTPKRPRELEEEHRVVNYLSARTGRGLPRRF